MSKLKLSLEDLDHDISQKEEECNKHKNNFEFINDVIKQYRPKLLPEGGIKPMPPGFIIYDPAEDPSLFLTKLKEKDEGGSDWFEKPGGDSSVQNVPRVNSAQLIRIQDIIPVTGDDIHCFISEKCDENLFLIDLINEEQRQKDEELKQIKARLKDAEDKVRLTDSTIKILEDRKEKTLTKINSFKEQLEAVRYMS